MSANATKAYLDRFGVTVEDKDLAVPDIDSLQYAQARPWDFVDRDGNPVPNGALELYRVEKMGDQATDQTIRAKEAEGFHVLPEGTGFRMRGLYTPGRELIMFRTPEQRAAVAAAEQRAQRATRQAEARMRHAVAGAPEGTGIEQRTERTEVQIPVRRR